MTTKKPAASATEYAEEAAEVVPVVNEYDTGIASWLERQRDDTQTGPVATYRAIVEQVLDSKSIFDVLCPPDVLTCRETWGKPFVLTAVRFNESSYEQGAPIYASMEIVWPDTQKKDIINSGVQRMVAQLLVLHKENVFPLLVQIERSNTVNEYGNYMYWLKFAPGGIEHAKSLGAKEPEPIRVTAVRDNA